MQMQEEVAQVVYSRLPADQANNYDQLKTALLKRYQLSADGFKSQVKTWRDSNLVPD